MLSKHISKRMSTNMSKNLLFIKYFQKDVLPAAVCMWATSSTNILQKIFTKLLPKRCPQIFTKCTFPKRCPQICPQLLDQIFPKRCPTWCCLHVDQQHLCALPSCPCLCAPAACQHNWFEYFTFYNPNFLCSILEL